MTSYDAYQRRKDRERNRQAEMSREGRDIGEIPKVTSKAELAKVTKSFRAFCELCFPARFVLEWSADHLEVIQRIEECVLHGRIYALAMPRGSGKTTLVCAAVLWAILTGRRKYVCLIGADKDAAQKLLAGIKIELETNEKLFELFPAACFPVRALEGKANKATGQMHEGKRTYIEWKGPRIVFPAIPNSVCSGAIIEVAGILGRVRGMQYVRACDGVLARPDMFVLDDPQTDRSAISHTQVKRRLAIISGAVLGLSGPGVSMSGFATVTVISEDDAADQLLDRDKFPDWQGKRYKLVYAWPTGKAVDLLEEYATIRAESLKVDGSIDKATAFWKKHQKAIEAGSQVAWPARKEKNEISALQHAYNLKLKSPDTFDAEYQNQPKKADLDVEVLDVNAIERKLHGYKRGELPPEADLVTSFIDVQGKLLYYVTVAWQSNFFTGWILDYGAWPRQTASYFHLRGVEKTLATLYPKSGAEGRWRAGLFDLIDQLSNTKYVTPAGDTLRAQVIGIDAAYGPSTATVYAVAREHPRATWLLPAFGRGLKPGERPMATWQSRKGERKGVNWLIRPTDGGGRHLLIDTNFWKTFVDARLAVSIGDRGSLSLFRPELVTGHRMIAEHVRAEIPKTMTINGQSGIVYDMPPNKPDNHLADCIVGCTVLASVCGATLSEISMQPKRKPVARRRPTTLKV